MSGISDKINKSMQPSMRAYEWFRIEGIAPRPDRRMDYEKYSSIKINKLDKDNQHVEIPLIHSDTYQSFSDPTKYVVLVKYVGSGRNAQAVGQIVRTDLYDEQDGITKTAVDNNVGVI